MLEGEKLNKIRVMGKWHKDFMVEDISSALKAGQDLADMYSKANLQIDGVMFVVEEYDDEDTEFEEVKEEE